ncbi:MAG: flavin reductase family protein [Rhizobiales bacterium]|nr:flavin reductase family protein [Hyphomicrobiales bacterium]
MELILSELQVRERYKFLTAIVTPRPIALVTTRDAAGKDNAAPFSFFNVFSEDPPTVILGLSKRPDGRTKDTLLNIRETNAFVVHMVDRGLEDCMHVCSADFPYGESELGHAGVTLTPARTVNVARIVEAPAALECRLSRTIELSDRRTLVLGEVVCAHIKDEILDLTNKRVVPERYSPLGRLYGDYYAWLGAPFQHAIPSYDDVTAADGGGAEEELKAAAAR